MVTNFLTSAATSSCAAAPWHSGGQNSAFQPPTSAEKKGAGSEESEWAVLTRGERRVVEVVARAAVDGSLLEVGHLVHVLQPHSSCVSITVFHKMKVQF